MYVADIKVSVVSTSFFNFFDVVRKVILLYCSFEICKSWLGHFFEIIFFFIIYVEKTKSSKENISLSAIARKVGYDASRPSAKRCEHLSETITIKDIGTTGVVLSFVTSFLRASLFWFFVLTNILYLFIRKTQQTIDTNGSLVNVLTLLPSFCANVNYLEFLLDPSLQT